MKNNAILIGLPTTVSCAFAVISGEYGNGAARIQSLKSDGYNPEKVQSCVNALLELFKKYGD